MYKETKSYTEPIRVSGFSEAREVAFEQLVNNLDDLACKVVTYSDGSTSVANMRSIEIVGTLIAANRLSGVSSSLNVDIVGGGWAGFAIHDLGLEISDIAIKVETLDSFKDFYCGVIFDDRNKLFLAPSLFTVSGLDMELIDAVLLSRKKIIDDCGQILGIDTSIVNVKKFEETQGIKDTTVGKIFEKSQEPEKTAIKFVCPDCSRQQVSCVEHGVCPNGEVVKTKGNRHVNCKAARVIKQRLKLGEFQKMTISELVSLGFYFSGKASYGLSTSSMDQEDEVLLVRNYSNSRGIMESIARAWGGKIGITRRYYFDEKIEIPGILLPGLLSQSKPLQEAIKADPFLVAIPEGDVFLPMK